MTAEKPRVMAHDDEGLAAVNFRFPISDFRFSEIRDALRGEANVVEGEIARDDVRAIRRCQI